MNKFRVQLILLNYPELSFAVDENCVRVLTRVYGQSSRVPFHRVLVKPVTDEYHVSCQVEVVQIAVGVLRGRLTDYNTAIHAVELLQTYAKVIQRLVTHRQSIFNECAYQYLT